MGHLDFRPLRTVLPLAGAMLSAGGCGAESSTGAIRDGAGGTPGGWGGLPESLAGTASGTGGSTDGSGGLPGGTGGVSDCLGPDEPGMGGVAGGACEGVFSTWCMDRTTLAYSTCAWLMYAGRYSVFRAVRSCLTAVQDPCTGDIDANAEPCLEPIYSQACPAPGTTVGGDPVDCAVLSADCPDVTEQECILYMSILNEPRRQTAYEYYFGAATGTADCAQVFHDSVGAPS